MILAGQWVNVQCNNELPYVCGRVGELSKTPHSPKRSRFIVNGLEATRAALSACSDSNTYYDTDHVRPL